jgi:hypothetical protein
MITKTKANGGATLAGNVTSTNSHKENKSLSNFAQPYWHYNQADLLKARAPHDTIIISHDIKENSGSKKYAWFHNIHDLLKYLSQHHPRC